MCQATFTVVAEQDPSKDRARFKEDIISGLEQKPKILPSKYFYDDAGSMLFDEITKLEEYYPTRVETSILREHAGQIAQLAKSEPANIVELGAGCNEKTWIILEGMIESGCNVTYKPIDINVGAMQAMKSAIDHRFGNRLVMNGIVADYIEGLAMIQREGNRHRNIVLFLGSNIGNMSDTEAQHFLLSLRTVMKQDDRLIIGFDLQKDIDVLERAYNDARGVTAAFNLNLLGRINRELGANFDTTKFRHQPFYDPALGAMVSWLVSTEDQDVEIPGFCRPFWFRRGEGIRTEMSRKFSVIDIGLLAAKTRFKVEGEYSDPKSMFIDSVFRPK
ncbi:MAG: L-histidine N(alpha)-methyltransferase [bacterium]|nr:L-histidine N(alpha)-methyltransferase [bacterium]